jgi:hypothetical protein
MAGDKAGDGVMCALHEQALKDTKELIMGMRTETREALKRIEAQTTLTNGRIRALERWRLAIVCTIVGMLAGVSGGPALMQRVLAAIVGGGG